MDIHSETSERVYHVSQNSDDHSWACSCPGWKVPKHGMRHCKHLKALGHAPVEVKNPGSSTHRTSSAKFNDYPTYDTSNGHGSPAEWQAIFNATIRGLVKQQPARSNKVASQAWNELRHVVGSLSDTLSTAAPSQDTLATTVAQCYDLLSRLNVSNAAPGAFANAKAIVTSKTTTKETVAGHATNILEQLRGTRFIARK